MKNVLKKIIYTRKLFGYIRNFQSFDKLKAIKPKTFLLLNLKHDFFHTILNFYLAILIKKHGHRSVILSDSVFISHYDNDFYSNLDSILARPNSLKAKVFYLLKRIIYRLAGMASENAINFEFIRDPNLHMALEYSRQEYKRCSIPKGHFLGSHNRYFGGRPYDRQNDDHVKFYQENLKNYFIIKSECERLDKQYHFDKVLCLDGIYTIWGSCRDYFHDRPFLIYQHTGFQDQVLHFDYDPFSVASSDNDYFKFLNFSHQNLLRDETIKLLEERTKVPTEAHRVQEQEELKDQVQKLMDTGRFKKVVSIYPNITWDGSIEERDIVFTGLVDWVVSTIEYCTKENIVLILREHPENIKTYSTHSSIISLLNEKYSNVISQENVILVKGPSQVSSFYIASELSDVNLVYNGTLILELVYKKLPVVVCANSPYVGKNVCFETKTKGDYFSKILEVNRESFQKSESAEQMKENSMVASSFRFFNSSFYFPLIPRRKNQSGHADKYWKAIFTEDYKIEDVSRFEDMLRRVLYYEDLRIRPIESSDAKYLYELATEQVSRQNSFSDNEFTYEDHLNWFEKRLSSPDCHIFMFESNGPVGYVRVETDSDTRTAQVSISIDKRKRGVRLGIQMISHALASLQEKYRDFTFIAQVKQGNEASSRVFLRSDFVEVKKFNVGEIPALEYHFKYGNKSSPVFTNNES